MNKDIMTSKERDIEKLREEILLVNQAINRDNLILEGIGQEIAKAGKIKDKIKSDIASFSVKEKELQDSYDNKRKGLENDITVLDGKKRKEEQILESILDSQKIEQDALDKLRKDNLLEIQALQKEIENKRVSTTDEISVLNTSINSLLSSEKESREKNEALSEETTRLSKIIADLVKEIASKEKLLRQVEDNIELKQYDIQLIDKDISEADNNLKNIRKNIEELSDKKDSLGKDVSTLLITKEERSDFMKEKLAFADEKRKFQQQEEALAEKFNEAGIPYS